VGGGAVFFGYGLLFLLLQQYLRKKYRSAQIQYDQSHATWQQAMSVWNRLFYCHTCDRVFDPSTARHAPTSEMNNLLYHP